MGEAPPSMVPLLPTAVVFRHRRRLGLTTRAASRYSQLSDGQITAMAPWMTESTGRLTLFYRVFRLVGVSPGPTMRKAARDDRSADALPRYAPRGDHRPA
jgi:hypothetical protein